VLDIGLAIACLTAVVEVVGVGRAAGRGVVGRPMPGLAAGFPVPIPTLAKAADMEVPGLGLGIPSCCQSDLGRAIVAVA
jgi:hypothetical protein